MSLKLKLLFKDRVGIIADISAIIAKRSLNIFSLEVERRHDQACVYMEAENGKQISGKKDIFNILGEIPDLLEISLIDTLPQEERENRVRVVLDDISDGVISIDRNGKITTINRVARRVFNLTDKESIGQDITTLNLPHYSILECLHGKDFNNVKQNLITETGRYQYFSTGRPIRDSSGRIIGAVEIAKDMQEIKKLAKSISEPSQISFSDIIGRSPAINEAIAFAQKIAGTDSVVSIRGASGTGKELLAHAIHTASSRSGPFVPVSCAALPEQLLESELFGYVGGAFTGSLREGKQGLFEIARDGTIFLDEISEMPLASQAKILRVIQEKKIRRIGGSEEIPVDTRIITATNQNLEQLMEQKLFRQDLYYRVNVLPIHIPPLEERIGDIPILVEHFLFQLASKLGKKTQSFTPEALDKLSHHNWPGNVRELKNVIERAAILCDKDTIDIDYILFSHEIGKKKQVAKSLVLPDKVKGQSLKESISKYEKEIIMEALANSRSMRGAAKLLGMSHTALLRKLKKLDINMET
ncbi:MAG: sigma 54-interacting transcriptional regulator [Desulfatiglandales bacterium]